MSEEQLALIEQAAHMATSGPWAVDASDNGACFNIETADGDQAIAIAQPLLDDRSNAQRKSNARFIALANPQTVLTMIQMIRAARRAGQLD